MSELMMAARKELKRRDLARIEDNKKTPYEEANRIAEAVIGKAAWLRLRLAVGGLLLYPPYIESRSGAELTRAIKKEREDLALWMHYERGLLADLNDPATRPDWKPSLALTLVDVTRQICATNDELASLCARQGELS